MEIDNYFISFSISIMGNSVYENAIINKLYICIALDLASDCTTKNLEAEVYTVPTFVSSFCYF